MDSTASFCIALVIQEEGGYVNDPQDPGRETNFGISKRAYPQLDIPNLTVAEATTIYYTDYWVKNRCGEIPGNLALYYFNLCVMSGGVEATKILQNLLGVASDGVFGPVTLQHAQQFPADRHYHYLTLCLEHFETLQNWEHDKNGWTDRLFKIGSASVPSSTPTLQPSQGPTWLIPS